MAFAQTTRDRDLQPTGKGYGERNAKPGPAARVRSNGISYHGGPVILGGSNVYIIWYGWQGNYADSKAQSIVTGFVSSEGGSPYFNINTTYYNGSNVHVSNAVTYKGSVADTGSLGSSLSDANIQTIVANHIGSFGYDPNGVYFVLTSADVNETSGFCTQYCGWHTHATINGNDVKYAFVGNPARCLSACADQTTSPNGDAGGDGMVSIVAHELEEATSDPDLNAWYDTRGEENADKCAWTFGTESTASNGSKYNMTLGSTHYLVQQNWVNASGGYCSMSY